MTGVCCDSTSVSCGGACCDTNHTCSGSSCTCQGYAFSCGGCSAWNFETNTIEGWGKTPTSVGTDRVANNGVVSLAPSTGRYNQGTHSMAVSVSTDTTNNMAAFAVPLCPTGATVSVPANITVTASIYFTAASSFALFQAELYGPSSYQSAQDPNFGNVISGSDGWLTFHMTFSTAVNASYLGFYFLPGGPWNGTVYVDGVKFSM